MKKNALAMWAAAGFAASLVVAGCTVTSDSGTDGGAGSGGSGATGGTGGTAGTGGTGGTSGSAGMSGSSGTGGSAGAVACNPNDPANSTCDKCVQTNCCNEWLACTGSCATEFPCFQQCVFDAVADGGTADPSTLAGCASNCAVDPNGVPATPTNNLIACINDDEASVNCHAECLSQ